MSRVMGYIPQNTTARNRLPNRRPSFTFEFECCGLRYTATISRFEDGRLAEIFVANHKTNSSADVNAHDGGVLVSLLLQHGIPLETIHRSLARDSHGRPSGPLAAALDLVAKMEAGR